MSYPKTINHEAELEELLSTPTPSVIETMSQIDGEIIVLGAGGKMGPTLAKMAANAVRAAGTSQKIYAVSRFSNEAVKHDLQEQGVETLSFDLQDRESYSHLPDAKNVIFMAGKKFGSSQQEWETWAMNVYVPALVMERYTKSRIVAFSTGNVYPFVPVSSGGSKERDQPQPIGEYAQTCLGRERIVEYFSRKNQTPAVIFRLNYAAEMRYGVLVDIAQKVLHGIPIDLTMGYFNIIWQGDANAYALQSLSCCESPPTILNVTGPDILSIRKMAEMFGERFGETPIFKNTESDTALLNNARNTFERLGLPQVQLDMIIDWIVDWLSADKPVWNKPTHFEERKGNF